LQDPRTGKIRYVGRTARTLDARLVSHRKARCSRWLEACNADLAAWLRSTVPAGVVLDEVSGDADLWAAEKAWIEKLADEELLNVMGNPLRSRKRRGDRSLSAAAA
jgi:hypothetical protein